MTSAECLRISAGDHRGRVRGLGVETALAEAGGADAQSQDERAELLCQFLALALVLWVIVYVVGLCT